MAKKLLVLTHSAGFVHDYIPHAERALAQIGEEYGEFDVDICKTCSEVRWGSLGVDYQAILFVTTGELPLSQDDTRSFINAIRAGVGFIGVHNATDTLYQLRDYGTMLGGYFNGHPWTQEITAKVEDTKHPSTKHLPQTFKVKEEVYTFKDWSRTQTHVLISLLNESVDLSKGNRVDNDYALCWCHNFGQGRIFYTAFGHFPELWNEAWFKEHLRGGINWAMRSAESRSPAKQ